jgi:hypothetical protein
MNLEPEKSIPKNLYRYSDRNGIEKTLMGGSLKVTPPLGFNDPFEMKPVMRFPFDNEKAKRSYEEERESYEKEGISFDEYCRRVKAREPIGTRMVGEKNFKLTNETFGAICFSRRRDLIPLWSYYAGAHSGAVIEFDTTASLFAQLQITLHDVVYSPERVVVAGPLKGPLKFLYTKSEAWAHEVEMRLLVPLQLCIKNGEMHLLAFSKSAVSAVYLGCRFDDPHGFAKQLGQAGYGGIPIFQMSESQHLFSLEEQRIYA